jgi:cyclophilin family peptidyl-prolyl cis-trans isomerase
VVAVETSKGAFEVTMYREWSPLAVDRAYYLMDHGFYDGARFYRVNAQYAQFGFSGRPGLDSLWKPLTLPDEPVRASNVRGAVTFARAGPESRNYVLFINLRDNTFLDSWAGDGVEGFPPIGAVTSGLEVTGSLDDRFGDELMIFEDSIVAQGNTFFSRSYPQLDSIVSVEIVRRW